MWGLKNKFDVFAGEGNFATGCIVTYTKLTKTRNGRTFDMVSECPDVVPAWVHTELVRMALLAVEESDVFMYVQGVKFTLL